MNKNFTQEFTAVLGKTVTTPSVQKFFKDLGVKEVPAIKADTGTAYIERPDLGFSLLLTEPASIMNPAYSALPKGEPVLTNCFYYSEGHDGYSEFRGGLPGGLLFAEGRTEVMAKLGAPEWKREKAGRIVAERWTLEGKSIHVTYRKNHPGILIIAYGIPEEF